MPLVRLIANPSASGFTGGLHREVVGLLSRDYEVDPVWPRTPAESRALAATASADRVDIVVAMGGDGVVHHVANGLAGTTTALGIIPAGTTNVLARLLGIPSKPRKAAAFICDTDGAREMPLTALTLQRPGGTVEHHHSTFAAGVGLDADVVGVADQEPYRKYSFGGYHYARSAAEVVLRDYRHRPPNLTISIDGERVDGVAGLIQLHSRYTYFGRIPLGVARHEPGTLSVLVLEKLSLPAIPGILAGAILGRELSRVPGARAFSGVSEVVIGAEEAPAQADGEALGAVTRLQATVDPAGLVVVAPSTPRR